MNRPPRTSCRPNGPRTASRRAIAYVVAGLVLLAAYYLDPAIRDASYVVAALGAAGAIVFGITRHRAQQRGWWVVALGLTLFSAGHALHAYLALSTSTVRFPSAADAFYFAGGVAFVIGIVSLACSTAGRHHQPDLLDATLVAITCGYVAWVALVGPLVGRAGDPVMGAVAIAVPVVDMMLVGVLAFHLVQSPRLCTATLLLAVGVVSWLVADLAYAATAIAGSYARGDPADAGWLIGYVLIAAAGLHPSMATLTNPKEIQEASLADRRLMLIAAAVGIPIVFFALQGPPVHALDFSASVAGAAGVAVVASARLMGSIRASRNLLENQRALQRELDRRARIDDLTGLINRAELNVLLSEALNGPDMVGLLFLDLDDFKRINDAFGHQTGDALLRQIADRLRGAVRARDHVARLGGDEFAILLGECRSVADAVGIAERVLGALARDIRLEQYVTRIRPSIGIVCSRPGELTADQVLGRADIAMYLAKERGGGVYEIFAPQMHDRALVRARLRGDLERAVTRGEIVPWYQPIVDIRSGELLGIEALARWQHRDRGLLAPSEFIGLAELSGTIGEIDRSVLFAATTDVGRWRRTSGIDLQLHVNFSPREIADPATVLTIGAALDAAGLAASELVVEITETALVVESTVATTLDGLKALGVRLAIDDFGSRYAVLAELGHLPIDILKIDRSLVAGVNTPRGLWLLRGVLRLADSLQLQTVAEGVESATILPVLRSLGCTAVQGYALGRPMPADALERQLHAWTMGTGAIA
jgi:diguanylate cyclase (GGDEF)-like protein